ncbi:MAG TPA: PAS-domain containing protein [Rhizomicrobium sp.]|nr:PAS-domain containing protein [Rhizomicrobium sp.]
MNGGRPPIRLGAIGALAGLLASAPAGAAPLADDSQSLATMMLAAGALALGLAAAAWALAEHHSARKLRRALRSGETRARAAMSARDALIAAGREAVIVWGPDNAAPRDYGLAEELLASCLAGSEATLLSEALDALSDRGAPFAMTAHDRDGRAIAIRGRAVGAFVAVWLEEARMLAKSALDFGALLDALPVPVWLRDRALSIIWGNEAYLAATGMQSIEAAIAQQATLEKTERDLATAARAEGSALEAKRFTVVGGQRRALAFTHVPLENGHIVGAAVDVTDVAAAEARLQQHIDASSDTLDKLATAVAIFDREQKLNFYNRAFAQLWDLPETWLEKHPTDGEVLDRLRDARKLPEQRDYQAWKRQRLSQYEQPAERLPEELWHVPGGKTLRVVAQPHPFGGLTFLYEDVTEKLTLESSYNTLIKVQSATLDTLTEAVAVFGPDAKLKLHNAAFARIWAFDAVDLSDEPHVQKLAEHAIAHFGDDTAWKTLVEVIASGAERRRDWGEIERSDNVILSVSLAPLPDGATLVTFADVTDRARIETALRDRAEALEAADRLKSDFVHHASFLFRDPLNAVQGFAGLLSSGHAGELTDKQREYVNDILTASNALADVTSDILDLAMIDSGAMRLELARVDLYELLTRVSKPLRAHAKGLEIEFALDCPTDGGEVIVDPRRLRQVVFNLLSNAFKYTPRGGAITLGGAIFGDDVQIYVADNGPGIAPDVKANVFDRFAAKSRAGQRAGAGLGLALVNRFIELHDGWVEIESAVDQGTIVRCHIPRRISDGETRARKTG